MAGENKRRLTVQISKELDIAVRTFLAQQGLMKKGSISEFIEKAILQRLAMLRSEENILSDKNQAERDATTPRQ